MSCSCIRICETYLPLGKWNEVLEVELGHLDGTITRNGVVLGHWWCGEVKISGLSGCMIVDLALSLV